MFGIQFYPTPKNLSALMLSKIDWTNVYSILEPSAGKGDILLVARQFFRHDTSIDCIEIDKNLCAVLKEHGFNAVNADFLEYQTYTRYDTVLMNPPFHDGDKHLLKVLDLMKFGGQIACILNAETIRNPNTVYRQDLIKKLERYHADIEFIQNAFSDAEHETDVEVALIYVNILKIQYSYDLFRTMEQAEEYESTYKSMRSHTQLATNDAIANALTQYNEECRLGLSLIDQFERFADIMPKYSFPDPHDKYAHGNDTPLISISVSSNEDNKTMSLQNKFIRQLRIKYWKVLFNSNEISKLLTESARAYFQLNIEKMRNYDFTYENIKALQIELSGTMSDRIEEAIMAQFEDLTYQHSMSKNSNVHYYDGWKTNNAYKINSKVIIPCYGLYNQWGSWDLYKVTDKLDELEKVLTYLNAGVHSGRDVRTIISSIDRKGYDGDKIKCEFFEIELKKKGTIHLWFTDKKLLKKWNVFVGKKLNFLPNTYGTTAYDDMTEEEQKVVDAFEGKRSYQETVQDSNYYLSSVQPLALMMNRG